METERGFDSSPLICRFFASRKTQDQLSNVNEYDETEPINMVLVNAFIKVCEESINNNIVSQQQHFMPACCEANHWSYGEKIHFVQQQNAHTSTNIFNKKTNRSRLICDSSWQLARARWFQWWPSMKRNYKKKQATQWYFCWQINYVLFSLWSIHGTRWSECLQVHLRVLHDDWITLTVFSRTRQCLYHWNI